MTTFDTAKIRMFTKQSIYKMQRTFQRSRMHCTRVLIFQLCVLRDHFETFLFSTNRALFAHSFYSGIEYGRNI